MPFNECQCSPSNPDQWCFLGASVMSFTANVGWGESASSVSVQLVEDPEETCDGRVKKYLDEKFAVQETTLPDSGFFGLQCNLIGVPVLFRYDTFEFAGIVSSWEESTSASGKQVYTVNIDGPAKLLGFLTLIIDSYNGDITNIPNTANLFGFYEKDSCSTFGDSGNYGQGMTWNAMSSALTVLTSALSPLPPSYSPYLQFGRIRYVRGENGGCGLVREDDTGYMLDLSELPVAPSYYRFTGTTINFLEVINTLTSDAAIDWFAELYLCCLDDKVYKIIKIRTIDRSIPPAPDSIEQFINLYNNSNDKCGVISYSRGIEERDGILHSALIGPPKQQMYAANWTRLDNAVSADLDTTTGETTDESVNFVYYTRNPSGQQTVNTGTVNRKKTVETSLTVDVFDLSEDIIAPFWGVDTNNDVIKTYTIDFFPTDTGLSTGPENSPMFFLGNSAALSDQFFVLTCGNTLEVSEPELLAALGGFEQWETYISQANTQTYQLVKTARTLLSLGSNSGLKNLGHLITVFNNTANAGAFVKPVHMLALRKITSDDPSYTQIENDITILYNWVINYAQQYYGTAFMVRVPEICAVRDPDTGQFFFNYEPSEGGWNEFGDSEFSTLLDINIPSDQIDFFRLTDGRIGAFCQFQNANLLHYDHLSEDDYGYIDHGTGYLWVKCEVDPLIYFGDYSTLSDPRIVIRLPAAVNIKNSNVYLEKDGSVVAINQGPNVTWSKNIQEEWITTISQQVGANTISQPLPERAKQPYACTFPLINNLDTYGPWYALNSLSIGGQVNFTEDQTLTPWNLGSYADMNTVASAQAQEGTSNMYFSESGSITIPGSPTARLGDELMSVNGLGYVSGQYYASTRLIGTETDLYSGVEYVTLDLINYSNRWIGTYGPAITSISTSVSSSGITTTYNLSSFRRKIRRFSRASLNRMKELGQLRQSLFRYAQQTR